VTRLQRLTAATFAVTTLQVSVGAFTRGSGSGFGCADRWPLCEDGLLGGLLPRPEFHMVVEWTHRWVAAVAMTLTAATALYVWLRHRHERALRRDITGALLAIVAVAGIGAVVVKTGLHADTVSLHLAVVLVLLGLLAAATVESAFVGGAQPVTVARPDPAWRRRTLGAAALVYALAVLGSVVHDRYVAGWPLVGGQLLPPLTSRLMVLHVLHRAVALVALGVLLWLAVDVARRARPGPELVLMRVALGLLVLNIALGAAHVVTRVESTGLVVAHLLVASLTWSALVAAAVLAHRVDAVATVQPPVRAAALALPR
jgi:heme A synthase